MNVVDLIEAARPEVRPMPQAERRMVRERLFGAADDVVRTTIRERSQSGAVTSTAPPGYRAKRVRARPARPRASGSLAKAGAGLLVVGAAAAAGWSWYSDADDPDTPLVADTVVSTTTTSTTAPPTTTTVPPTRTGVTDTEPVVFPLGLIPVEEAVVDVAATDDAFALLRAGDDWIYLDALGGGLPAFDDLDFETIGSIDVFPVSFGENEPWIYIIESQCGSVRVIDAPGGERLRPLATELLEGLSIDAGGTVDALLPAGVRVVEAATGLDEYRTVFRFERDDGEVDLVTLRQVPGGSLAQVFPAGTRPSDIVWLGEAALATGDLDPEDDEVGAVTVIWRDGSTVFAVGSETVSIDELETFVSGLRAVSTTDWIDRFSAGEVDSSVSIDDDDEPSDDDEAAGEPAPACAPQPSLGSTFLP